MDINCPNTDHPLAKIREYRSTRATVERRQLNHLPPGAERRTGSDRRSVVVNSTIRPAGGPNGHLGAVEIEPDPAAVAALTAAANLYEEITNPGAALQRLCMAAAVELCDVNAHSEISCRAVAAIIYKHVRLGKEL